MPRFRIEYLTETTDEDSVCCVTSSDAATLDDAGRAAFRGFEAAHSRFAAQGFQIRDMSEEACTIVAIETIDGV